MPRRAAPPSTAGSEIAIVAQALGDPSRAAMLDRLLGGDALPVGELALAAAVSPATASTHVARLRAVGLVIVTATGRERRVAIAGPAVAEVLERLAGLGAAPPATTRIATLRAARLCYDHLAGALGVLVAAALVERGWMHPTSDTFEPAPALLAWLATRGHPVDLRGRRPLTRACLDWTERVPHLAGRVGAAVADVCLAERWVVRRRDSRALRLTDRGRAALVEELGVRLPGAVVRAQHR